MPSELVNVHVRLTPDAAQAWNDAARQAGTTVTALAEAIGQRRIRAIGREPSTAETARAVDRARQKRPGPRPWAKKDQ